MAETTPGFAAGDDDDGATDAPEPGASPPEEPTCALCGGRIGPDDVVCPHCGASLVAG